MKETPAETDRRFNRMQWRMLFATMIGYTLFYFMRKTGIAGMLFAGWATDRFCGGRAPRLCAFLMALTAGRLAAFWFLHAGVAGAAALCLGGFCLYGPQALTGVT